jgi:hypothetical protein
MGFREQVASGITLAAVALLLTGCGSSPASPTFVPSTLCSFSLPPGPFVVGTDGGSVEIPLTTQAGCTWNSDALDFLSRNSAESTGMGGRNFTVNVSKNVGGRRQGRFRVQGFVGVPFERAVVEVVTISSTIEQEPLIVPVPTAPSYIHYAAPYPSWGGVTRVIRDGMGASLGAGVINGEIVNIVVRGPGGGGPSEMYVTFGAPRGQTLRVGTYEDTLTSSTATNPSLSFTVGSVACSQEFGRFTVHEVMFTGSRLERIRASFEVACNRTLPPVVGEVWYVAR